jgi:hypothetical protein
MDWIVLEGVKPWDGRYPFDIADQEPTTREWGWIKRLSGYLPLTIEDGLKGGDPELFAVFAVIALRRAGRITPAEASDTYERLIDVPYGATIRYEADEPAEVEPDSPPPEDRSGNGSSSGTDSPTSSETLAVIRPASGIPASDTSESLPVAWET